MADNIKTVSSDNLARFKQKCDETYATISNLTMQFTQETATNIDNVKDASVRRIYTPAGTLPAGTTEDIVLYTTCQNDSGGVQYGSQILLNESNQKLFSRNLFQNVWSEWAEYVSANGVVDIIYPVGAYYITESSTTPASLFGGNWAIVQNRFLLGTGVLYDAGDEGGEATHTLTEAEMPNHWHNAIVPNRNTTAKTTAAAGAVFNGNVEWLDAGGEKVAYDFTAPPVTSDIPDASRTGGGQAHNNMPPYRVVYIWRRTA